MIFRFVKMADKAVCNDGYYITYFFLYDVECSACGDVEGNIFPILRSGNGEHGLLRSGSVK